MKLFFNRSYKFNYSKYTPALASGGHKNFTGSLLQATGGSGSGLSPLERARRSLAKNAAPAPPAKQTPPPPTEEQPPQMPAKPTKPAKQKRPSALASAHKNKRPPVFLATFTGLLLSAVVLLAATGLYGAYCYSQGLPGDTNVRASTLMYSLAVFFGCFWASAMVKRQSLKPLFFIGSIYIILSLVISYQLLDLADFKPMMILLKVLLTAGAALLGYFLSLIPYLINKRKKNRKKNGPAL